MGRPLTGHCSPMVNSLILNAASVALISTSRPRPAAARPRAPPAQIGPAAIDMPTPPAHLDCTILLRSDTHSSSCTVAFIGPGGTGTPACDHLKSGRPARMQMPGSDANAAGPAGRQRRLDADEHVPFRASRKHAAEMEKDGESGRVKPDHAEPAAEISRDRQEVQAKRKNEEQYCESIEMSPEELHALLGRIGARNRDMYRRSPR